MSKPLPRSRPESLGIPSTSLLNVVQRWEKQEAHSIVVVRHGQVAAEGWWRPFKSQDRHVLYSLSKSFCATAVGMAVSEGLLTLDDRVHSFFPEFAPEAPSENLRQMRVRDLLCMGTGHAEEPFSRLVGSRREDMRKSFFAKEVPHEPGRHFLYNSVATFMCSAIIQKLTGKRLTEYLKPRLFDPLGIDEHPWDQDDNGIEFGGWGLHLKTEDIAKFGLLCLQDGWWEGQRLMPATWVAQASAKQIRNGDGGANDWAQGYGFQFWRCQHDCFRGDGAFGQLCVMSPKHNLVVAGTASVDNIQDLLTALWEELLPSLSAEPLPENTKDHARLTDKLAALELPQPKNQGGVPNPKLAGRYEAGEGAERITLGVVLSERSAHVEFGYEGGGGHVAAGFGAWLEGGEFDGQPVAASAAWHPDGSLLIKARWTTDCRGEEWVLSWDGADFTAHVKRRGVFWAAEEPPKRGKRLPG